MADFMCVFLVVWVSGFGSREGNCELQVTIALTIALDGRIWTSEVISLVCSALGEG